MKFMPEPATEHRDARGVRHCMPPIIDTSTRRGYGRSDAPHYRCGCSPSMHRFKCCYCEDVVGWCCGAADDEPYACDACWSQIHEADERRQALDGDDCE